MTPQPGDALLIVDLQNDFVTGTLAVPGAEEVIAPINGLVRAFAARGLPVFASRDWHPADHRSFEPQGGTWPVHCVAGTAGAELVPELELPSGAVYVDKATEREAEAYSALSGTPLADQLRALGVRRVFVAGLATDYCVVNSVRDLAGLGFEPVVIADACRAVNLRPGDGADAEAAMQRLGARIASAGDVGAES
jgi:nicotinamidase/pyrazinamidase